MTDKTMRLTISIPGSNREVAADVVFADLAKKLRSVSSLPAGQHEILVFQDGSVVLDAALVWELAKPAVPVEKKVG